MNVAESAARYWHTLRYLRPVQWYGRLWFRLWRPRLHPLNPARRTQGGDWRPPASRVASLLSADRLRFLNREHSLPATDGWNDPAVDKLWLYNLHYFDDLNAESAPGREPWHLALLQRWVAENPPTKGNGWEPYPTSLRIVNWIKWSLAGHRLPEACDHSLALQARWLAARMEWHLLGNHLFANAKALIFAGLFFAGDEADRWVDKGLRIIARELPEQVLADGGHFERSPMYHALFLEDLLDLVNAADAWPLRVDPADSDRWRKVSGDMLAWLEGMLHPDGDIAFFNDAAISIAPSAAALRGYAERLGVRVPQRTAPQGLVLEHWGQSGYIRLSSANAVALLDVAPVGPDYLPGHAHADTLSFELSVGGRRVVVNGGTSRYGVGPERTRERSTGAHSTVEVAGQDSSEVWSGFRVARRARPFDLETGQDAGRVWAACSHDGYCRLRGRPVHRRIWAMDAWGLTVTDSVSGRGDLPAVARFILHPEARVDRVNDATWTATLLSGLAVEFTIEGGSGRLEPAHFAPEFGKVRETHCLTVHLSSGKAVTRIAWDRNARSFLDG